MVHLSDLSAQLRPGRLTIGSVKIISRCSGLLRFHIVPMKPVTCLYVRAVCINHEGGSRNPVRVWRNSFCLVGLVFLFLHDSASAVAFCNYAIRLKNITKSRSCTSLLLYVCDLSVHFGQLLSKIYRIPLYSESKSWLSQEVLEIWDVNFYFHLLPVSLIWTVSSVSIISQWKTSIGLSCLDFIFLTKKVLPSTV